MENTDTDINASPDIHIYMPTVGRADYNDRRAARIDRLESRAQKTAQAASARFEKAHEVGSHIPFGQPI